MRHKQAHETKSATISHALLFLVGVRNLHVVGGRKVDDGSVMAGAGDVHHDAVAAPGMTLHHTWRRRVRLRLVNVRREGFLLEYT